MSRTKKVKDVGVVLAEALALPLADRVSIVRQLGADILREVQEKKEAVKEAESIINGNPLIKASN